MKTEFYVSQVSFRTGQPGADSIGEIHHRGHCDGIADPHNSDSYRNITFAMSAQNCTGQHLKGHGKEAADRSDQNTVGDGIAIHVPKIRFEDDITQDAENPISFQL